MLEIFTRGAILWRRKGADLRM